MDVTHLALYCRFPSLQPLKLSWKMSVKSTMDSSQRNTKKRDTCAYFVDV